MEGPLIPVTSPQQRSRVLPACQILGDGRLARTTSALLTEVKTLSILSSLSRTLVSSDRGFCMQRKG